MGLIKDANNLLKSKDPVEQAIEELEVNEAMSKTYLDDTQVAELANFVNELITNMKAPTAIDAAYMALENVPGFETASHPILKHTVQRIVDAYHNKFK